MTQEKEYNGWSNHATWNVSEGSLAFETPDGVSWTDSALDHDELNEIFSDMEEENSL